MSETTSETTETLLAEISKAAPDVAREYDENQNAIAAERDAEATVLAQAIAAAKPALRALATKIRQRSYETSGRNGCNPVSEYAHHKERGVLLVDEYEREGDSTGNRGSYSGKRLYLLTDGRLAEVERSGSWSQWQGEGDEYETTLKVVTVREAMETWSLLGALLGLAKALKKEQEGERSAKTRTAKERANRLAALATLSR